MNEKKYVAINGIQSSYFIDDYHWHFKCHEYVKQEQ